MSLWQTLTFSAWTCLVLSQTVAGDLATQGRNLRLANQSAEKQNVTSSASEASRASTIASPVVNQTTGRASNNSHALEAVEVPKVKEAKPLLPPPNVSEHSDLEFDLEVAEAGTSPSNATALRGMTKSAAGWVGCWYYRCRSSYHPEFYCQCNPGCQRFRNCCWDYSRRCGWQDSRRRRTQDSRRRRSRRRTPQPQPSPPPSQPDSRGLMTGYHQTSPEVCRLIVNSAFRAGNDGHCGGAIYFAVSPEATKTKAIGSDSKTGCVIEAKVDVGRVKYEGSDCGHKWTKGEFDSTGYNSIRFNPGDGDEIVIYDSSRVKSMRIIPYNNAWRPTYNVR